MTGVRRAEPARRTPVDRREQGLTLIEMTVVLLLLSIIMTAAIAGVISVQRSATNNLVREQGIEQAEIAMQVISRDLRATADSSTSGTPMISVMSPSTVTFASDIDTTSSANPMAAGTASNFAGCPDQITITGSTTTPGTITETRTHPNPAVSPSTVVASCNWTGSTPRTRVLATNATLSLSYLTYVDPTVGAPQTSTSASTTAAVRVSITVPPSNKSPAVPAATLVQTVQLAGFTSSLSNAGS